MNVTRHPELKSVVLELKGEIDYLAMTFIREQIEQLLEQSYQFFFLDMDRVHHIEYASFRDLVECARKVRNRFGGLCFTRLNPYLKNILQLMDVNRQFEFFEASEERYLHKIYPVAAPAAVPCANTA